MPDIKYELTKEIGVLSENSKCSIKELNLVSWNDREPIYDIREWSGGHEKLGKGVTLSGEKIKKLRDVLNRIEL
jgi:hypothetical protein